jgi:pilus assembly protein TadC/methionine-rich copper-binding protein CopC
MAMRKRAVMALVIFLVVLSFAPQEVQAVPGTGPVIVPVYPGNNTTILTHTPTIVANFSSPAGFDNVIVSISVDGVDVSYKTTTVLTNHNATYAVPAANPLSDGQHNVTVNVTDDDGVSATLNWTFYVNTQVSTISAQQILLYVAIGVGLGVAGFAIALIYLRRARNFSLRKYLKKHPIPKRVLYIGIPAVTAFFFVLIALSYFEGGKDVSPFMTEYILVIGIFILLLPYSIYVQTEKKKKGEYERSFAQFLFEMADAMRGGIDPSRAIIEMSKNDTSILKKHLKIAANGLEMGRPFEEMIEAMVKPIDSRLIKRYASLIGESAKVGGEISQVVHRAAKDMDDLIKIEQDRTRSLSIQGTTIYISFGVLVVVIYLLISIYPSLGAADLGGLFGGAGGSLSSTSSSATSSSTVAAPMDFVTLKQRFLDLTLITGLGSGLIIGLFTNGKIKFGLIHGLGMMLAGMVFLIIMIG